MAQPTSTATATATSVSASASGSGSGAGSTSTEALMAIVTASTDPADKTLVVRQVVGPGSSSTSGGGGSGSGDQGEIITFSVPFSRLSAFPIGGRTTAIKHRASGDVLIYVSHPHTKATAEIIQRLAAAPGTGTGTGTGAEAAGNTTNTNTPGRVAWLVTPDGEHGMYFGKYAAAYPDAKTIGVPEIKAKYPKINWTGVFGEGGEEKNYGFEDEMSLHRVSAHQNDELVLFHAPSSTLVEADMLFNLPPTEQYSRAGGVPWLLKVLGGGRAMTPGGYIQDKIAEGAGRKKELLKRELAPIQALNFTRIIPCHGEVIETGAKTAWDKVWAKWA